MPSLLALGCSRRTEGDSGCIRVMIGVLTLDFRAAMIVWMDLQPSISANKGISLRGGVVMGLAVSHHLNVIADLHISD